MLRSLGFGLGLETFANFLRVSVSVSENLVSEKRSRYRIRKIWYRKKVSVSVLVKFLVSSFSAEVEVRKRGRKGFSGGARGNYSVLSNLFVLILSSALLFIFTKTILEAHWVPLQPEIEHLEIHI